jgi:hypothetical protein
MSIYDEIKSNSYATEACHDEYPLEECHDEGQVQQWLNRLREVVAVDKELTLVLRKRLSPILRDDLLCDSPKLEGSKVDLVAVADNIRDAVEEIESISEIKQDILNCLEV